MAEEKSTQAVDDVVEAEVVEDDVAEPTEATAADAPATPAREVIFVDAPTPPRKRGNRAAAVLLAIPATLIFLALLIAIQYIISGGDGEFLGQASFYYPALFLFVGLALLGLVLNRAGWWSYIGGSVLVGALVWLGSASLSLVSGGMLSMTQPQANEFYFAQLFSATSIIAALLAREVAMWTGAVLARRGRALKERNAEAYAAYEKEQADLLNTGKS
jgi:hypothetical protein